MRTTTVLTLLNFGLLAAAPAALHAQSLGVTFGNGSSYTTLDATDPAGVPAYAQTNWQNVNSTPTDLSLSDSTGAATTALLSATTTGGNPFFGAPLNGPNPVAGADERLNNGVFAANGGNSTVTLSLTNIPYSAYSLLVYDLFINPGFVQSVSAGALTFYTSSPNPFSTGYLDNNAATPFTYTQGTGLTEATATANADYVLFPALTGSSLTFSVTSIGSAARVSGFQIVNTGAAAPEPSTCALALVGGAGLLGAVRSRRRRLV